MLSIIFWLLLPHGSGNCPPSLSLVLSIIFWLLRLWSGWWHERGRAVRAFNYLLIASDSGVLEMNFFDIMEYFQLSFDCFQFLYPPCIVGTNTLLSIIFWLLQIQRICLCFYAILKRDLSIIFWLLHLDNGTVHGDYTLNSTFQLSFDCFGSAEQSG